MNHEQLKQLIDQVDSSSLREFELELSDIHVKMSKNEHTASSTQQTLQTAPTSQEVSARAPIAQTDDEAKEKEETVEAEIPVAEAQVDGHVVHSPIVGVAYLAPGPEEENFKKVGDQVKKGDTLCIVEAMKVMNEITSDVDGILVKYLVEDGQAVEYNQPLYIIDVEE